MEVYYYSCQLCGYIHQVPSYWVEFDKTKPYEQPHLNPQTNEVCSNTQLDFQREEIT